MTHWEENDTTYYFTMVDDTVLGYSVRPMSKDVED